MKKSIVNKAACLGLGIVMTAAMMTGCGKTASAKGSDVIKIGGIYPLTGDVPALGASMENGAKLAVKEINSAGGVLGKQIELISEDDQNQASVAPNAITKLIDQDKVVGVVGTYASSCSIPMAAVAKERKIPMISIASTNERVTVEGGEYVFRACFIDPWQGKVGADFAFGKLEAKTAAMMYDMSQDYCIGIAKEFKTNFEAAGGKIVYEKTYNKGDSDFKAFLTEISSLGVDVLYLPDNYSTVGLVAKQAREMGIECDILGSDSWSDPGLVKVGGEAIEGSYFTDHASMNTDDEKVKKFVQDYQAEYSIEPSAFSILGYDAVKLMANAIKNAGGTDASKIKDALTATDMDGLASHYKFDANRNPIKDIFINKVEGGKFVFVDQIPAQ